MDKNLGYVMTKRIDRVIENLRKNNMAAYYVSTKEDVVETVRNLIGIGFTVASGGSVSLAETGVIDLLRSGAYKYLDREGLSREDADDIQRKAFAADAYLCSSNAVTENGELYNVDGNANRIAAIAYGPKSVIMIVGYNKIVSDLEEAALRVKKISAPANCQRLSCDTYCHKIGECMEVGNSEFASGCGSDSRICCSYLISSKQRIKNRIKVIIVGEELGY